MAIHPSVMRTTSWRQLPSPAELLSDYPCTVDTAHHIMESRKHVREILRGNDDRLLVIIGPCSIHDPKAAYAYAEKLKPLIDQFSGHLHIVMRTYFEKPRTTTGWKGLIFDPHLDGSNDLLAGITQARKLVLDINELGIPTSTEFLDNTSFLYLADLMSWGAIGARTTESQVHRQFTSGLPCPVGFKNGTDGNVRIATDAILSSRSPHLFTVAGHDGQLYAVESTGNADCHIIMRGGRQPNYSPSDIQAASEALEKAGLPASLMVDCSHGNSQKQHKNQLVVAQSLCEQISQGKQAITAIMAESFLEEGRQDISDNMTYGQSVTDACLNWHDTEHLLVQFAEAVAARRDNFQSSVPLAINA
ncbi:3-deoxy-7-phosphoheptulonate synthase [Photobacterium alginatilyticum]|uniref:Phospho-2-dehydro-3-deoxyheptonate aldolase n=1 Tax=Photobacterium alginatilyticum TaxID=1775171 RepID=A0ABW9YKM1_9GAMM|nr:3-deoxy-7-phosphoheptulonate synthase [Photobacterium alginatilyticum]NBI53826.1 3-deoxy-7-phosphoheptulonate synthase [Photobacterium alginatilyticum]